MTSDQWPFLYLIITTSLTTIETHWEWIGHQIESKLLLTVEGQIPLELEFSTNQICMAAWLSHEESGNEI